MKDHFFRSNDDRPRCPRTGKVILTEHGADLVIDRERTMQKYSCGNHWHVGHPVEGRNYRADAE